MDTRSRRDVIPATGTRLDLFGGCLDHFGLDIRQTPEGITALIPDATTAAAIVSGPLMG